MICLPLSESVICIRWPKDWSFFSISLSVNSQGWFPLGWTGLISLLFKGLSRAFSSTTVWKHQFFCAQPLWSNTHIRLQYPCLENSMDQGAWWATVSGVKKSWKQLSDFHFLTFVCDYWKNHNWLYGSLSAKVMFLSLNFHKGGQTHFVLISVFTGPGTTVISLFFKKLLLTKLYSKNIRTIMYLNSLQYEM